MKTIEIHCWEDLRTLDGFVSTIDKDVMVKGEVVYQYEMPQRAGMEPCGIAQCSTPHRKGYVIAVSPTLLSIVGHKCGKTHFGQVQWGQRLKAFRRKKSEQAQALALQEALRHATQLLNTVSEEGHLVKRARLLLSAIDGLPDELKDSIVAKSQDGDSWVYQHRQPTDEERRKAKFHGLTVPTQVTERIGKLEGLNALRPSERVDRILDVDVPAVLDRVRELAASSRTTVDAYQQLFRRHSDLISKADRSAERVSRFFEPANIQLLSKLPAAKRLGIKGIFFDAGGSLVLDRV